MWRSTQGRHEVYPYPRHPRRLCFAPNPLPPGCPGGWVDLVSYGANSAPCAEGNSAAATTNSNALVRADAPACVDTNDNATDFAVGAANPRTTASAPALCTCP